MQSIQNTKITAKTTTKIAGVSLPSYIFNAAGPNDVTYEELDIIAKSASSAVTMKSCTIEPREGNEEPRYADLPLGLPLGENSLFGSINSMGLPNLGYKEYIRIAGKLKHLLKNLGFNKPVVASVAGLCLEDYIEMLKAFQKSDVDLIEVNLSCPNIKGKPQVAYDFEKSEEIISKIENLGEKPIGLKLPPYYDFVHHEQMAEIIKRHKIRFLTLINSIGNALYINPETEMPAIRPKMGFGGLGGKYIKPVALANVRKFYELLNGNHDNGNSSNRTSGNRTNPSKKVDIIGCGGIYSGTDAFEYLLAGASAVQLGTVFVQEGASCFERINMELSEILARKGYKSIEEVKGKLKGF